MDVIRTYAEQAVALSRTLGDDRWLALTQGLGAGALAGWNQTTGFENEEGVRRALMI